MAIDTASAEEPARILPPTAQGAAKAPGGAVAPLYAFVKDHLVIANNVLLAAGTLVGALDFLGPKLSLAPHIVYAATAALLLLMVLGAAAPARAARLMSALGFQARSEDATPMWRRPAWQFIVAILAGVSVAGVGSIAKAKDGGVLAAAFPSARAFQESLLGLHRGMADIKLGVDAANAKLDGLAERSADPQRDLASLGYPYDDQGLMRALRQEDARALGLFIRAGYKAEGRVPLLNILGGGGYAWSSRFVAMLPPSMFSSPNACDDMGFLSSALREPEADRVAAFKRLCPDAKAIARLRAQVEADKGIRPYNEGAADAAAARKRHLAMLGG